MLLMYLPKYSTWVKVAGSNLNLLNVWKSNFLNCLSKSFCFYSCKSNLNRIPPTRFSTPDRFLTDNWNIWPRLTRTSTTSLVHTASSNFISHFSHLTCIWTISLYLFGLPFRLWTLLLDLCLHIAGKWGCCEDNIVLPGSSELLSALLFTIWTLAPFCWIFFTVKNSWIRLDVIWVDALSVMLHIRSMLDSLKAFPR